MNVTGPVKTLIAGNTAANTLLDGRVWPTVLDQNTAYPAVALNAFIDRAANSKTDASTLDSVTLQVDVYAYSYAATAEAAAAIRTAIDYQQSGSLEHIEFKTQEDMFSAKPELFRIMQTYSIGYRREL